MIYYTPKYFAVQELVDPETFKVLGSTALILFQAQALWTLDAIRAFYNAPVIVNNWHVKGHFKYRGYRPASCNIGAQYSQHRLGNAFDFNCNCKYSSQEIQQDIMYNPFRDCYKYITAVENVGGWVHIDFRNRDKRNLGILYFNKG